MLNTQDEINKKLLSLCAEGVELYIVGGYIRDILLDRECYDRDYAVKGQAAIEFAQKAAEILGLSYHQFRGLYRKYAKELE